MELYLPQQVLTDSGREQEITCYLEPDQMITGPGPRGQLALEVKADNIQLIRKLNRLSDQETDICVKAERQFLNKLEEAVIFR